MRTALLLVLLALSAAGLCAATSPLSMLFTLDCQGTMHFPLGVSWQTPSLPSAFATFQTDMIAKAKAQCSSLTQDQVNNYFTFPQAFLYYMGGNTPVIPGCPNLQSIAQAIMGTQTTTVNLPTTCTAAGYAANGCSVALNIPNNGGTVNLLMTQCPSSSMPFIQVTASGTAIDQLLMPCASNSDCTANGFSCVDPLANLDTSFFPTFMSNLGYSSTCSSFQSFISMFRNQFWSAQYGQTTPPSTNNVCMPPTLFTSGSALQPFEPTCSGAPVGNNNVVSCPFVAGPSVSTLTTDTLNGKSFITPQMPGCIGSLSMTCGGSMAAVVGNKLATQLNLGFLPSLEAMMVNFLESATMSSSGTCGIPGGSGATAALASFWLNYAPWSFAAYMARFTGQPNLATIANSPMGKIFSSIPTSTVNLPSSCTYAGFTSTSTCKAEFTGLTSLLMSTPETDAYLEIDQCPNTMVPAFNLQFTGPWMNLLSPPQACTTPGSTGSCTGGLTCQDMTALMPGVNTVDMYAFFNPSASTSAYPGSAWQLAMNYLMGTNGQTYGYNLCMPPFTQIGNNGQAWQQGEVIVNGVNNYGLKDLTSYTTFQCPSSQIYTSANDSAKAAPTMICMLFALLLLVWNL